MHSMKKNNRNIFIKLTAIVKKHFSNDGKNHGEKMFFPWHGVSLYLQSDNTIAVFSFM